MSDSRDLVDNRNDPYTAYGSKVGTTGQYLSFKAGEFLSGQNAEELPIGSKLVANMPGLRMGWRRWFSGSVSDDLTELLSESPTLQKRSELGDMDQAKWEKDDRGESRDPWQLTNILELSDGQQTYIFSTGSKGGINAIGRLCRDYGKERRQRPGMLPIIELSRDSYMHPQYKKVYTPDFKIVGWTDADNPSLSGGGSQGEGTHPLDPNFANGSGAIPVSGQRAANPTQGATSTSPISPSNKPTRF